jgi:hypothetical protein
MKHTRHEPAVASALANQPDAGRVDAVARSLPCADPDQQVRTFAGRGLTRLKRQAVQLGIVVAVPAALG